MLFWLWNTRYPPIREYKLYFTEERRDAALDWQNLSESWTEAQVRAQFTGYPIRCIPDETRVPGITRMCVVDLKSLNGVPTMTANFLFKQDRLSRVATSIPWWSHARGLSSLTASYGTPHATQVHPVAGVRLQGWKLPTGGAVFYNMDPELNPLQTNSTQWLGPSACAPRPCIR
jgi:hypothetical protein